MSYKKRILFASEASYLSSGFARYNRELITRIFNSNKFCVAEFAQYGSWEDPRSKEIPWIFYGNLPDSNSPEQQQKYNSRHFAQFGEWRLEEVVLDFKPDVVMSLADLWMASYLFNSPLRRLYNIGYIACVDSAPIRSEWLAQINEADAIFGYVDWTIDIIRQYSDLAKCRTAASPGANLETFKPVQDKKAHKQKSGLNPDSIIFGMVGRNQKRKLYPSLFRSFRLALDKLNECDPELADKALLYIHSSMPDAGYDFGYILHTYGLSRKVVFTYICQQCKQTFVSFYQDARTFCPKCGQYSAQMPNVGLGVADNVLCDIYNLMDCYIQYATNEGAGMPQIEAGACGVATMATDHTAMGDIVRKLGGVPLKVKQLFHEVETQAMKAVTDDEHLAEEIVKFCQLPENVRRQKGTMARMGVIKHFDYQKSAQRLMEWFDEVQLDPQRWYEPPRLFTPATQLPSLKQEQFVDWIICNVLGEPERLGTHFAAKLHREINQGYKETSGTNYHLTDDSVWGARTNIQGTSPEAMANDLRGMCENRNHWERVRCGIEKYPMPRYIEEAHKRIK